MTRTHPDLPWCRYADDGLVHCRNEQEAQALKAELQARLAECRLEMHPTKTKIVYCKDGKRNPLLRGWIEYGRYAPSALYPLLRYVNQMLLAWAMRKFRRFKAHKIRASRFLQKLSQEKAGLFVHWRLGMTGTFA